METTKRVGILIPRNWLQPQCHICNSFGKYGMRGTLARWNELAFFTKTVIEKTVYPICIKVCSILYMWYVFLFLYQNWMIQSMEKRLVSKND